MKLIHIFFALWFFHLSCNPRETGNPTISQQEKGKDTIRSISNLDSTRDDISPVPDHVAPDDPPLSGEPKAGEHPISLHWLGWDNPGTVKLTPTENGWYSIKGGQQTSAVDYLKIDGRIRRLDPKELEFEGTIETRTKTNFNGASCIKTGKQRFFAKGTRTYYRLQNMDNCMGNRVVDYVDIFPGSSGL